MILGIVAGSTGKGGYLLDTYTGAKGAWSLRRLKTGETDAVKIRRDNDNATTIVYLESSGSITMSSTVSAGGTLTTWIGSNSGYVDTWYDQSGNGLDKVQTAFGTQPRIINAGSFDTLNGEPCIIVPSGSDGNLSAPFTISNTGDAFIYCSYSVGGIVTSSSNLDYMTGILPATYVGDKRVIGVSPETASGLNMRNGGAFTDFSGTIAINTQYIISTAHTSTSSNFKARQDGTLLTTGQASYTINMQSDSGFVNFQLNEYSSSGIEKTGIIQEDIWWVTDNWSDASNIETNMNNFYSTY